MQSLISREYTIQTPLDVSKLLDSSEKEEVFTQFRDITLVINDKENGTGTLHLTNLRMIWLNGDSSKVSYSFPYKSMMFHAISKDNSLFNTPCIFIQQNSTHEEEDDQWIILSPKDSSDLETLFDQISKMSTLNDAYSSDDEDEVDCEIYEEE